MLPLILAALIAPISHASTKVIATETGTARFASLEALRATCSPGLESTGHNFPTFSTLHMEIALEILPNLNVSSLFASDPHMDYGDHCASLLRELGSLTPANITMTRKITEDKEFRSGHCVRLLDEQLSAKIGEFDLMGESTFVAETLPDADCR